MEILYSHIDEDADLLQLINLSGFNGVTVGQPVIQKDIRISLQRTPAEIEELSSEGIQKVEFSDNTFTVRQCGLHKAYRIRY